MIYSSENLFLSTTISGKKKKKLMEYTKIGEGDHTFVPLNSLIWVCSTPIFLHRVGPSHNYISSLSLFFTFFITSVGTRLGFVFLER
jgi:hypothetical protein